jgi:hypothetical protein
MTTQHRIPYFSLQYFGLFALRKTWQQFDRIDGCRPLDNPQARILMERKPPPLPGEKELLAKQAAEKRRADVEEAKQRKAAQKEESRQSRAHAAKIEKAVLKVANDQAESKPPEIECRTPPPFDMLDLPDAMNSMRFFYAAQLARRWFNSRKHTIPNDDRLYAYPADMVETKIISLDFILKHPKARAKYNELIDGEIYTEIAVDDLKKKMNKLLGKKFIDDGITFSGELDTLAYCGGDIQKLHERFQFQSIDVSSFDSLTWDFGLTELTATLANFSFKASIANARVYTEKYYSYPKGAPMIYCCEPTIEVTHIYVYARDSYSFADRPGKKASQYLGHWNRNGVVLVAEAVISDLATKFGNDIQWGDIPYDGDGFDRPVDLLRGMFGQQMRKQDVYYPIRNTDYQKWREKFNRGGDFIIYTKPKKIKLRKPIKITLGEICKPANLVYGK